MVFVLSVLISIYLICVTFLLLHMHTKYKNYWKSRSIPSIEPDLWHGNTQGMGTNYHTMDFMKRVYNEFKGQGGFGGAFISVNPVLVITNLDLVKSVLIKDFKYFQNRGIYYNSKDDPISEHISNIEDEKWKNVRSKLTPTFTSGKLKLMFETISSFADKLNIVIKRESSDCGSIEIKDILARFTSDVIGNVAFGIECDSLKDKNSKFYEMAVRSMNSFDFIQRLVLMGFRKLARLFKLKLTPSDVSEFHMNTVKEIILQRKNGNADKRADLMNILIDLMKRKELTFNQVVGNAFFYFVAGYETSSTTLTFCLFELSQNQKIQQKARNEVMEVLENHDNVLSYEAINEMEYVEKIIKETLRKWPPSVSVQRETTENYQIPNTNIMIDKHTSIIVPVYGIHHDPDIYENPNLFDPSRFDKEEVEKRHPLSFLSFGDGPRNCPGIRFSLLEIKICLAKLLINNQMTLDRIKTELPLKISPNQFMINPENGVYVKFDPICL